MRHGSNSWLALQSQRTKTPSARDVSTSTVLVIAMSLVSCTISTTAFQRSVTCRVMLQRNPCHMSMGQTFMPRSILVTCPPSRRKKYGGPLYISSHDTDSINSTEEVLKSAPSVVSLPTTQELLMYIFTTVLVWTSEPLLSIVDSATVGSFASRTTQKGIPANLASVVQLASLGPATMLCDSSIFLTYFIGLAATNKLARASTKNDWKSMIEISSHSLGVSVALSLLVLITLIICGEPLLRSIIGPTGAIFYDVATNKRIDLTSEVVRTALGYTWIRALAAGFAITGSTAQSLLLCVLDTPTVTFAVLVATVLNTVGDLYLVVYKRMGVLGAAIATSIATIVSNIFLIWKGRLLVKQWRLALWTENQGYTSDISSNDTISENKTDVKQYQRLKEYLVLPFISLPGRDSFHSLVLLAGPIFLVMVAKIVEFWYMTIVANNFGLRATACHNLLMRIFLFFAVFGDGVSQASQTFLPGLFNISKTMIVENKSKYQNKSSRLEEARKVIRRLSVISGSLGIFVGVIAYFIARNAGGSFTSDKQLVSLMSNASTLMGLNLVLNPLTEMFEGVIIASRDTRYLLLTRGMSIALFLGALKLNVTKFTDIWRTLLVSQFIKILLGLHFWTRRKKIEV